MSARSNSNANYEVYWNRLQESARYHPANRFRYFLIASRLRRYLKPGLSLLDMGCGDARLLLCLRSQWPQNRFAGCDISHKVIGYNREQNSGIEFFQADVSARDFAGKASETSRSGFDIVICSEVIEHVEDDRGLLQNAAALLAPGGYLILTTQSGPRYRIDFELVHHLRHYRRSDLEGLVRATGLEVVESFSCGFPVLSLQKIIANAMLGTVMRSTASGERPPGIVRAIMLIMYVLMRFSPKWSGPQIFIAARRPEAAIAH